MALFLTLASTAVASHRWDSASAEYSYIDKKKRAEQNASVVFRSCFLPSPLGFSSWCLA